MISVDNITKRFDGQPALDSVSMHVADRSVFGLVGSNGAGKSTLMRIIAGIYRQDGGTVLIDERPVFENTDVKNRLVYVADDVWFPFGSTPKSVSDAYRSLRPTYSAERFHQLMKRFELPVDKQISSFSKGMRRQLATVLALSVRAEYLLFDETFDGLDPIMRNLTKKILSEDILDRPCTVIITSHSMRELEDVCDQLALLHKGGMVLQSDVTNLRTRNCKVQIAFSACPQESALSEAFGKLHVANRNQIGSVISLIVRDEPETIKKTLAPLSPQICDILPLTLEEVFTYELEALGYHQNEGSDRA